MRRNIIRILLSLAIVALVISIPASASSSPSLRVPYSESTYITSLTWAHASTIIQKAEGSDTWPMTWADDGHLYTTFGDGWGFEPEVPDKLSLGLAKVSGPPTDFEAVNIRSSTGEHEGNGASGKKASGMLMVDGTLYMWVRNADGDGEECQLAWSHDHAKTWEWNDWNFEQFGYCVFLNFGKNYAGARDEYIYMYSPDTPSAYVETEDVVLTRVHKSRVTDRDAYDFFAGLDRSGKPIWTPDIDQRQAAFTFPGGGSNRLDVTYNSPIGRYLMTMRSRAEDEGLTQFSIYEAPEPWGPWRTVYYTEEWEGAPLSEMDGSEGWGESQHIPSKWISPDGKSFYLVFAYDDSFGVRKATLTLSSDSDQPPAVNPDG